MFERGLSAIPRDGLASCRSPTYCCPLGKDVLPIGLGASPGEALLLIRLLPNEFTVPPFKMPFEVLRAMSELESVMNPPAVVWTPLALWLITLRLMFTTAPFWAS